MADGEESDDSQKTEDPTQRRLEEARRKGQVAVSREANNWLMLMTGAVLIASMGPSTMARIRAHLQLYLEHAASFPSVPGGLGDVLGDSFLIVLGALAAPFIILMLAAFLGPFLQTGPIFAVETLQPDISKISPMKGFKRLFSKRSLMEFAKGVIKLAAVGFTGMFVIKPYFTQLDHMVGMDVVSLMDETMALVMKMLIGMLTVLFVLAVIDVIYQRMEHMKQLRMSKHDIKEEYRQTEGDPHVKGRLRQLRAEKARQRMLQAVPKADVVITNPTHYAIALEYKPDQMMAPKCVAKGVDDLALRIREVAKESSVVVYEAPPLARALYDVVEVDEEIPAEQYKAVAEVISFVFKKKGRLN